MISNQNEVFKGRNNQNIRKSTLEIEKSNPNLTLLDTLSSEIPIIRKKPIKVESFLSSNTTFNSNYKKKKIQKLMEEIDNFNDNRLETKLINDEINENFRMNFSTIPSKNESNSERIIKKSPINSNKNELSYIKKGKIDVLQGRFFNLPINNENSKSNSPASTNIVSTITNKQTSYLNKFKVSNNPQKANSSEKNKNKIKNEKNLNPKIVNKQLNNNIIMNKAKRKEK